jgi:hypothetical protein
MTTSAQISRVRVVGMKRNGTEVGRIEWDIPDATKKFDTFLPPGQSWRIGRARFEAVTSSGGNTGAREVYVYVNCSSCAGWLPEARVFANNERFSCDCGTAVTTCICRNGTVSPTTNCTGALTTTTASTPTNGDATSDGSRLGATAMTLFELFFISPTVLALVIGR